MSNPVLDTLADKANRLPLLPGVYIMLDEHGEVIYVGKAKKLKNRVSSYFHGDHLPKVAAMVDKVRDFNVIVAGSEFEALVLENSLIKRHKPHYNILLKDDKGYPFIRLDMKQKPDAGYHLHRLQSAAAAGLLPQISAGYRKGTALPQLPHGRLRRLVPEGQRRGGLPPPHGPGGADPRRQEQ